MALAKARMKVVEAPKEMTVPQLREFLASEPFKAIYFDPVSETQDCLQQLRRAIPEFYECNIWYVLGAFLFSITGTITCLDDDTHGQIFHSKYFPTLRYFIHTGFDIEIGGYM